MQTIAKGGPHKCLVCPATDVEKEQDTLIEQSNILIKQSLARLHSANLLSLAMPLAAHILICLTCIYIVACEFKTYW